jgi:hypothetical protein
MRTRSFLLVASVLVGCGDKDTETEADTGAVDTAGDTEVEPASDYASGQHRVSALVLATDPTVGVDLDGDGEVDNKLPTVLQLAATLTGEPLDVVSLNAVIASDIAKGTLILLTEQGHTDGVLTLDALLGEEADGTLSIDEASYSTSGEPNSRFTGAFSSQTEYAISSERIELPFPIIVGQPAVQVPLELVQSSGTVDADSNTALIGGAVPVDDFMTQVIEPIIPTGEDYDPDAFLGMSREELLSFIYDFATGETVADIELSDGRKAVSAAVTYEASAATF